MLPMKAHESGILSNFSGSLTGEGGGGTSETETGVKEDRCICNV
jgi:hypothetical protein